MFRWTFGNIFGLVKFACNSEKQALPPVNLYQFSLYVDTCDTRFVDYKTLDKPFKWAGAIFDVQSQGMLQS